MNLKQEIIKQRWWCWTYVSERYGAGRVKEQCERDKETIGG